MTRKEFGRLDVGDIIRRKNGLVFIVVGNYGSSVDAVRTVNISEPKQGEPYVWFVDSAPLERLGSLQLGTMVTNVTTGTFYVVNILKKDRATAVCIEEVEHHNMQEWEVVKNHDR